MRPKILYHGSPHKLRGNKLLPKKAEDLEKNKYNLLCGVYASSIKNSAISMAIISAKGVWHAKLNTHTKTLTGIIYRGWPKQKYIYLHTLNSKNFKNIQKSSCQWISEKPVKPIKTEKLKIKDYLHLIKKATKKKRIENKFK